MGHIELGVSYWHPRTQFRLHAVERTVVQTVNGSSRLKPVVDVDLRSEVVPDIRARQSVHVNQGILEKLDLQFTFDDRGLLESLNSESSRDITPVLSVVGKIVGILALAITGITSDTGDSLEEQWDDAHPQLAGLRGSLQGRAEHLLSILASPDTTPTQIVEAGQALSVIQSYQLSIGELRRGWITSQAGVTTTHDWCLAPADLVRVEGVELPDTIDDPTSPPAQEDARSVGILLAVADPERSASHEGQPAPASSTGSEHMEDVVFLRGSRPAQVGVYLCEDGTWTLQDETVMSLDLVDESSPNNLLSLDGSFFKEKKFALAYHPDKSLKTFGITASSSASSIATSIGGVVDSASATAKAWAERPSAEAVKLDKLKADLELAKTETELEVLAATRGRAAEAATLEQAKTIRDAQF